ncbi:Proteinase inhibitor I42 [Trypanosoma melophagium]|uniref:Proteinase inhibitor I42 n=1 Tax=Trypanosoma melophagium TaxID=715481 RepID=UPI003519E7B0|nr:Proteinase inhibitor I42 [Trypanosoma melophagium]
MPRKLTQADDGKLIFVPLLGSVLVELPSNPTTGFTWFLDGSAGDSQPVEVFTHGKTQTYINKHFHVKGEYVHPDTRLMGAGGKDLFRVTPRVAGEHDLVFVYARAWGAGDANSKRFRLRIRAASVKRKRR